MEKEQNTLYPIFLKLSEMQVLVVGGGNVGFEKISFMLKSSPDAQITLVSPDVLPEILELIVQKKIIWIQEKFSKKHLKNKKLVLAATNKPKVNLKIYQKAKSKNILANVADTPQLCDFYLGAIVSKGNLKIAISTNGKSPTVAKQIRILFEEILPENLDSMLEKLSSYRKTLQGHFAEKVEKINAITASLTQLEHQESRK